jgi:hypothetical protein
MRSHWFSLWDHASANVLIESLRTFCAIDEDKLGLLCTADKGSGTHGNLSRHKLDKDGSPEGWVPHRWR